MPSTMGYVGGESYNPVHYPPKRKPRGFARNLGGGRPAHARSNTIRQAMQRRRGRVHGISEMPQVGGAGNITSTRGHHDRGQPPMASTNVIINLPGHHGNPRLSRSNSNQRGQGGRAYSALAGTKQRTASNDAVTRMRKPKGVRRGAVRGYTQG